VYVGAWNGGNVVVSKGTDGVVVVDPRAPEVDAALETWAPGATRTVIDTHSHRDHTLGNGAVARTTGVIIAHEEVRTRLATPQVFQGSKVPASPPADWPTRTYRNELDLSLNGEELELIHPKGAHTDGDTVVYFRGAHVVAMGDVFFPDRFPYVDPDAGGTVDALVHAIDRFVREWPEDTRIVPGHGQAVCTMNDLRNYQRMLHDSVAWVQAGQRLGLSLDSLASRGAPPAYKSWAWPLVPEPLWVALVARSQ
jgi:glyoxylase-like metal-dependent hydrolase (beta-lactamase superfamily II)